MAMLNSMRRLGLLAVAALVACAAAGDFAPVVVTESAERNTDDPALWVNRRDPGKSLILGRSPSTTSPAKSSSVSLRSTAR